MTKKVKWGILGAAPIARRRVVPAMLNCELSEIAAVASRSLEKSQEFARAFGIPKAYGSYDELVADPEIEVIYNPLPNHLHIDWSIRAASNGKHVLCEKPLTPRASEVRRLMAARDQYKVKISEAFMVRTNPQWLRAREIVHSGRIGKLRAAYCHFSYFNDDPTNTRNSTDCEGGALMDIGCYPVRLTRFVFGEEPLRVIGLFDRDPKFGTDRFTSAILEYSAGQAIFTCATQLLYYQRFQFFGTEGRVEVEIPFNAPVDKPCRLIFDDGKDLYAGASEVVETVPVANQFTIQADLFSKAIRGEGELFNPLEEAFGNAAAIEALFRSETSGKWEVPERL